MGAGVAFISIIVPVTFFMTIGFIIWSSTNAKNRRAAMQAEVQTRLIDRFSNAPEFVEFLNSETGRRFLSGVDKVPQLMARDRIVGGVSRGVILSLLGAAFLAMWALNHEISFIYPGFILLALGIGFFISTMVSLKLSQHFGLIEQSPEREGVRANSVTQA